MISLFHFFHFPLVIWSTFFSNVKRIFSFEISKLKIRKKNLFQISKMKIFNFFHFKFSWHISFFFISLGWYGQIFSNFNPNFKIDFFQFFPFPFGGMAKYFSKLKKINSNFKTEISQIVSFQIFLVA
jgi:hypothetical protein